MEALQSSINRWVSSRLSASAALNIIIRNICPDATDMSAFSPDQMYVLIMELDRDILNFPGCAYRDALKEIRKDARSSKLCASLHALATAGLPQTPVPVIYGDTGAINLVVPDAEPNPDVPDLVIAEDTASRKFVEWYGNNVRVLHAWCQDNDIKNDKFVVCHYLIVHGMLDELIIAHDAGYPLLENALAFAIVGGHLDIVKWLLNDVGIAIPDDAQERAAIYGQLHILKYLCKTAGGIVNVDAICSGAAVNGHIEILQYVSITSKRRINWDIVRRSAVANNQTELLMWIERLID